MRSMCNQLSTCSESESYLADSPAKKVENQPSLFFCRRFNQKQTLVLNLLRRPERADPDLNSSRTSKVPAMSASLSFIPLPIDVPLLMLHSGVPCRQVFFDANQTQVLLFHAPGILVRESGLVSQPLECSSNCFLGSDINYGSTVARKANLQQEATHFTRTIAIRIRGARDKNIVVSTPFFRPFRPQFA
jgi:hypothetical protein